MSQTAEPGHMAIAYAGTPQGARKCRAVELRIVARTWNRSHVDQLFHAICSE
jgi:hypothetical protein